MLRRASSRLISLLRQPQGAILVRMVHVPRRLVGALSPLEQLAETACESSPIKEARATFLRLEREAFERAHHWAPKNPRTALLNSGWHAEHTATNPPEHFLMLAVSLTANKQTVEDYINYTSGAIIQYGVPWDDLSEPFDYVKLSDWKPISVAAYARLLDNVFIRRLTLLPLAIAIPGLAVCCLRLLLS